ncbi:predicted protein [Naegleria gruberi]|uniref:Predicted protein n=1 Tax=Naegleria gruberi TaxID=5762 RepID=D2VHU9_NAEGR|nr:uncharacterized protein NAEGRDRAFT_68453 [Naegleria gruberi]EFC43654.1 predicted protein [Naegleria gruberi]|eukprot:XP_002676398.1 predicted protein [Naegleria gruberi strain NEG-M]
MSVKSPKLTPEQIKGLDPTAPPIVDVLNNGQAFFSSMKVHYCDVHPVKSWVVFADKRGSVYLFDYIQNDLLHTFSLNSMFESKKEETNLYKTLDKNFKNVQLPYWYDEELLSSKNEKFGDLKSVKFYDEHVQYWKLRQLNNMSGSDQIQNVQSPVMRVGGVDNDDESRSRMVGVNGAVGFANADRPPKCIVLHTESRIIMLRYDEVSSLLFFFDDVKSSQLDGKSIVCFDFLYKQPIVALGCSDGSIRFWDFQQRKVLNKIIPNVHSKGISQLLTVPRDDPLSRYPGIVTTSSDGSLALWNLDTEKAEYTEAKCQGGGISSMFIDTNSGYLITAGIDKSIAVRSLNSGRIIKQTKTKVPMKSLSMVTTCNCSPSWLLMLENKKQKRQIFRMPSHLNFEPAFVDNNIIDVTSYAPPNNKDPKFYTIHQHPLQQDLIFIGTSFGLMLAKMTYNRKPAICSGFLRADALLGQSSEPEMPSFDTPIDPKVSQGSNDQEKKKYCIYVREKNVYQRFVETNSEGKKEFSSEKVVYNMGKLSNVKLDVSYSGRYVSILWESEREYFVFDISKDTWRNIASERECSNIVWSSSSDTFAILKGNFTSKKVSVKKIENSSVKLVCENVSINGGSIDDIYGGVLLGVKYSNFTDESGFQLYNWSGVDAFGSSTEPYLPKPQFVVWDNLSGKCLMAYQDSYAIFNSKPSFKMEYYVEEKIQSAFWWNSTLLISTETEIKCVFVTTGKIFSTVLASTDVAFYSQISQKTPLDEQSSLDPIPLPKPKGDISFMDVVGDNLYVIDGLSQIHTINNISITPSIKFRMLVAAGLTKKAMEWIPFIAQEIHDYLADFLCAFGYTREACSIDSLSSYKRLQLCFEHEHIKYGIDALTYLDENRYFYKQDNSRSSNKKEEDNLELSRLFVRLGSVGEKKLNKIASHKVAVSPRSNNHFITQSENTNGIEGELSTEEILQIIEQSYRRAAELEPSTYSHLIIFCAKHFPEKLQDIRSDIYTKMETSCEDDHVMFNQSLTMLALVSKDFALASTLFQQANKWSQAATLDNSKVDSWNGFLNSKPNSLPVNIGN